MLNRMIKRMVAAALVFAAAASVGHAQLALVQQPRTTNGYSNWDSTISPDGSIDQLAYDNFTLTADANIVYVNWQGIYADTSDAADNPPAPGTAAFLISFWSDDAGQPGSLIDTETVSYAACNAVYLDELPNTTAEYSFSVKLPNAFSAKAGTVYWISIQSDNVGEQPIWSWISGTGGDGISYQDTAANGRFERFSDRCFTLALAHPAFFNGEADLGGGAYYLSFSNNHYFGYYSYLTDPDYIYHYDLGYEYLFDANDGKGGIYLYDFKSSGFFYTSPTFPFPYLYDFSLNSVVYYYPDPSTAGHYNTNGYRFFYVFNTGKIISK